MDDPPADPKVPARDLRPKLAVDTVDGLTVICPEAPRDGDVTAALTFRVGITDEPLAMRGICHLVEHLCLSHFRSDRLQWNGSVDVSRTTFYAHGPADEVTRFLRETTAALGSLPESRVAHERRVLQVEAQSRTGSIFDVLLIIRYGAQGPGLKIIPEWGLEWLEGADLRRWAADWFTASNAALWSTAPLPVSEFTLPAGERRLPTLPVCDLPLPVVEGRDTPLVALMSEVPRVLASSVATHHAARELWRRLRHEHGLSYSPSASYAPLTATAAVVSLSAETHADHRPDTVTQFLRTLDELAAHGPSADAFASGVQAAKEEWGQPDADLSWMDTVALAVLFDMEDPLYDRLSEDLDRLTPEDVAAAARMLRDGAVLVVPAGCEAAVERPFRRYTVPAAPPVEGRSVRWRYAPIGDRFRLTYGEEGVTHWDMHGRGTTVRFADCAGVVAWRDGTRLLYGTDGSLLDLRPEAWRRFPAVRECIDAHAPPPIARVDRVPDSDPDWERHARRWRLARIWERWGTVIEVGGALVVIGGLVATFEVVTSQTGRLVGIGVGAGLYFWGIYWLSRKA